MPRLTDTKADVIFFTKLPDNEEIQELTRRFGADLYFYNEESGNFIKFSMDDEPDTFTATKSGYERMSPTSRASEPNFLDCWFYLGNKFHDYISNRQKEKVD